MRQTFDQEKISFNLARLKKNGRNYEISVDPDLAIKFKELKPNDVSEAVKSPEIFKDVNRGELAPEESFEEVFGTTNLSEIQKKILFEGEIQLSQEHREKLREQKKNKILEMIHRIAFDPKTNLVHPRQRIELAFKEAKIHIDEFKSVEQQVDEIIKKLRPIIPISIEKKEIEAIIPANDAGKVYAYIKSVTNPEREDWLNDGSLMIVLKLPAGLTVEMVDELSSLTHGEAEIKIK